MKYLMMLTLLLPAVVFGDLDSVRKQLDQDLKECLIEMSELEPDSSQGWFLIGRAQGIFHCICLIELDQFR